MVIGLSLVCGDLLCRVYFANTNYTAEMQTGIKKVYLLDRKLICFFVFCTFRTILKLTSYLFKLKISINFRINVNSYVLIQIVLFMLCCNCVEQYFFPLFFQKSRNNNYANVQWKYQNTMPYLFFL